MKLRLRTAAPLREPAFKSFDSWNRTCYCGSVNCKLNLLLAEALLLNSAAVGF